MLHLGGGELLDVLLYVSQREAVVAVRQRLQHLEGRAAQLGHHVVVGEALRAHLEQHVVRAGGVVALADHVRADAVQEEVAVLVPLLLVLVGVADPSSLASLLSPLFS